MEGIDLGNPEEIWKSLTYEEREDFKRFAENSAEAIPPWTPWWTLETRKVLIEEIVENEDSSNMVTPLLTHTKLTREQPDFLGPIPSLSSLTVKSVQDSNSLEKFNESKIISHFRKLVQALTLSSAWQTL